jgi:hypothetical protein
MSKEHFFVIRATLKNGEPQFELAPEMEDDVFLQCSVLDTRTNEWESWTDEDNLEDNELLSGKLIEKIAKA